MSYVVYGRSNCEFCEKALDLLDQNGLAYKYIPLDVQKEKLKWFKEVMGFTSVPQVFLYDTHIGGYNELREHLT